MAILILIYFRNSVLVSCQFYLVIYYNKSYKKTLSLKNIFPFCTVIYIDASSEAEAINKIIAHEYME